MAQEGMTPQDATGDDVARLVALTERQHDLWTMLRDAVEEADRNRLFDELSANRDELSQLKERMNAELDGPATAPPGDETRSVGEQLRARILAPQDEVAPAAPPPPPPPPPPQPTRSAARPEVPGLQPEQPAKPAVASDGSTPDGQDQSGPLAPEPTPFSTREADLAATRARRETAARQPPPPEPPPPPAPAPPPEVPPAAAQSARPDPPLPVSDAETDGATAPQPKSGREARREAAHAALQELEQIRPPHARPFPIFAILVAVIAVAAVAWVLFFWQNDNPATPVGAGETTTTTPLATDQPTAVGQIRAVLDGLGLTAIAVEERSGTIFLTGIVTSSEDRSAALGAAQALAGTTPVDASAVTVGVTDDVVRAAALQAIADAGYERINVTVSGGVATLGGVTPEEGSAGLIATVAAVPGISQVVDLTDTSDRAQALESELQRIVSVTPIVFASGQTNLNALQERILDSVAEIIQAYSGPLVTIVGYTDAAGSEEGNQTISLLRAENVRDYLVAQGIPTERLLLDARGETTASGSEAVAGLERRVEFEVGYSVAVGTGEGTFRIGIVAPSARDDLAFTQSIFDAANVVATERSGVEIDITDNTFVTEEAAEAIRGYAADGYDLVIAHGSQYGTSLVEIAGEFPTTAFAWGTAADTFGLPNVSSYEVASNEGGYVMGVVGALLSESNVIGVVGPLEVGDAQLFVNGFRDGVLATNPAAQVPVTYTGSFSDVALAAEAATAHVDAGADVLTGTAQMVVGAVGVASENEALWFGTQSDQTALAPDLVVASQVYHWEVVLRQIISGIEEGSPGGQGVHDHPGQRRDHHRLQPRGTTAGVDQRHGRRHDRIDHLGDPGACELDAGPRKRPGNVLACPAWRFSKALLQRLTTPEPSPHCTVSMVSREPWSRSRESETATSKP